MDSAMESISASLQRITENFQNRSLSDEEAETRDAKLQRERDEAAERQRKEEAQALWNRSGVPARHSGFDMPKVGPWRDAYVGLREKLGTGFLYVVMGNRGTGKTQLGTCLIGRQCFKHNCSGMYIKALDVFIALREAYRKDGDAESAVINRFVRPDLLVIDAMEERGETAFEDRLLNHIIDKRYDNCCDTLLITNQTPEAFATSAGPSIISRIHETGDKIVCDWDSFRKKPDFTPARSSLPVGDRQ
jgi:DNA replication protein DnaC